jgi:hypothetical protein
MRREKTTDIGKITFLQHGKKHVSPAYAEQISCEK